MKIILSVIAVCLVMITVKLYTPDAEAYVGGKDWHQLMNDHDFKRAVKEVVQDSCNVDDDTDLRCNQGSILGSSECLQTEGTVWVFYILVTDTQKPFVTLNKAHTRGVIQFEYAIKRNALRILYAQQKTSTRNTLE